MPEPQQEHQLQEEAHEDGADNDKAKGDRQTDKIRKLSIRMKYMSIVLVVEHMIIIGEL